MPYLTHDEYKEFGFTEIDGTEFNTLLKRASDAVDGVTRHFYKFNDLQNDIPFRQEQFKKAIAAQVEYFHDMEATNSHGINSPLTVNIGRTQVMSGVENQKKANKLVSPDALMYLSYTGLLYKGL